MSVHSLGCQVGDENSPSPQARALYPAHRLSLSIPSVLLYLFVGVWSEILTCKREKLGGMELFHLNQNQNIFL